MRYLKGKYFLLILKHQIIIIQQCLIIDSNKDSKIEHKDQIFQKTIKRKARKMSQQSIQPTSFQTISIKFTESNLPSANYIKTSQQHISLTYTVSIQNMSEQRISFPYIPEYQNLSVSIDQDTYNAEKQKRLIKQTFKQDENQSGFDKEVFKKKSILKISNLQFSSLLQNSKLEESPQMSKARKSIIKGNFSGLFCKAKVYSNDSMTQSRNNFKSKEIFTQESSQNMGDNMLMRTTRFYSLKNDKIVEPQNRKRSNSIKKQIEKKYQTSETDRKYNRLPLIRGTNFHTSAPSSMGRTRKVLSCFQNAEAAQFSNRPFADKMILGKTCKMSQNDQKAKKYLQKIIQNRASIIHFSENRQNKITREFKQNFDDFV